MQIATLKTDLAKQQGSVQALGKIRDHLTSENETLLQSKKALEGERGVWEREREDVSEQLGRAKEAIEGLSSEVAELRGERERLASEQVELKVCLYSCKYCVYHSKENCLIHFMCLTDYR